MISPEVIADIRRAIILPLLVEESGLRLRQQGGRKIGWCPFCAKPRTPAFAVYQDHYYCHRCEETGTAIDWMVKRHGMRFTDAVEHLADIAGVSINRRINHVQAHALSEDRAMSEWWWAKKRDASATVMGNAVEDQDDDLAETAGNVVRWIDAMKPRDRLIYFQSHVTGAERKEYRAHVEEEKKFTEWWLSLAAPSPAGPPSAEAIPV